MIPVDLDVSDAKWSLDEPGLPALGDISSISSNQANNVRIGTSFVSKGDDEETFTAISSTTSSSRVYNDAHIGLAEANLAVARHEQGPFFFF